MKGFSHVVGLLALVVSLGCGGGSTNASGNIGGGDAATEDMRRANSKVVQMVLRTGSKR